MLRISHPPPTHRHTLSQTATSFALPQLPRSRGSFMLSLPSCPDAVLLNVWHHLLGDLPALIALAQTCRRLRVLTENDDDIWQSACFVAGFGWPIRREGPLQARDMTYRRLARLIVKHTSICEIRSCTKANACFGE